MVTVRLARLHHHRADGEGDAGRGRRFGTLSLITLLLFIGATGKSAQIPLYVWLPDAMEGPTPVSALIHAATMVTAGVYMIGRNAVLFEHAPITLSIVAVVGAATALMAGTIGLVQNDIKRVLAYSTVSQLGYMFLAMGVGAFGAGIFHLYHARLLQGLPVPRLGRGHPRAARRAGHPPHGRPEEAPADHLLDVPDRARSPLPACRRWPGSSRRTRSCSRPSGTATPILWVVGVLTSLLTATYMFRLVFLTFHGEERFWRRLRTAHGAHGHGRARRTPRHHGTRHARHGHGGAPARRAAGDGDCADRAGHRLHRRRLRSAFRTRLGGHNGLGTWLEPAFQATNCGAPVTTGELAGFAIENCAPGTEPALASLTQTAEPAQPGPNRPRPRTKRPTASTTRPRSSGR